jgi:hypothetical protein
MPVSISGDGAITGLELEAFEDVDVGSGASDGDVLTYDASGDLWIPQGIVPISGIGSNVVFARKSDQFTTSSSTYVVPTGLSATITPSSATSKVLVIATVHVSQTVATAEAFVQLFRDSTEVDKSTGASTQDSTFYHISSAAYEVTRGSIMFLDSPATTSATTYEPRVKCATGSVTINRGGTSTAAGAVSSITVIEVAA